MAKTNYYQILGVHEQATAEHIKKSYRALAHKHHPDRNPDRPDAAERFKTIQEAYDTLSDPVKRREYDRYRTDPFPRFRSANGDHFRQRSDGAYVRYARSRASSENVFGNGNTPFWGFTGFFNKIFGSEEGPSQPKSARKAIPHSGRLDIDTLLRLTFKQALHGGKTEVILPRGETVRIDIPRGVRPGFKIRLKGRGGVGTNAVGDLYVTFEIEPHPDFRRNGNDLFITCSINPVEAMLGVMRSVTSPYGNTFNIKIPPGIQYGSKLRLSGQGVKTDSGAGDLYVKVVIKVPNNLNQTQLEIMRDAARKADLI